MQRHSNQMRKLACRQMSLVWLQGAQACKKADSKRKTKQRCAQGCGRRRASHWSLRRCAATTWLRAGEARMNWKHICGRQETCMTLCLTERPLRHATAEMETYNDIGRQTRFLETTISRPNHSSAIVFKQAIRALDVAVQYIVPRDCPYHGMRLRPKSQITPRNTIRYDDIRPASPAAYGIVVLIDLWSETMGCGVVTGQDQPPWLKPVH